MRQAGFCFVIRFFYIEVHSSLLLCMNKKFLKEYFSFSRREQNGILVLASIIILLILINLVISWLPDKKNIVDKEKMLEAIQDFDLINQKAKERYTVSDSLRDSTEEEISFKLFDFDPNHITKSELLKLGISEKTATTFINYLKNIRLSFEG